MTVPPPRPLSAVAAAHTPGLDVLADRHRRRPVLGRVASLFLLVGRLGYGVGARLLGVKIETIEMARRERANHR